MGQRSGPAPFLTKTYELVEEESTDGVVSWNESGTTFVVWKTADFARDLLPKYFKHNNFSSFVRQLNTYGFRKTVPDKWEFANESFRRGHKDLIAGISRRKPAAPADEKPPSPSNSGSTSSCPGARNPGPVETADLSGKNEELRRDNEELSSELARTKNRYEELVAFLTGYLNVGPDQIDRIVRCGPSRDGVKLFGVWVKGKRGREWDPQENMGCAGPHPKEMRMASVDFDGE